MSPLASRACAHRGTFLPASASGLRCSRAQLRASTAAHRRHTGTPPTRDRPPIIIRTTVLRSHGAVELTLQYRRSIKRIGLHRPILYYQNLLVTVACDTHKFSQNSAFVSTRPGVGQHIVQAAQNNRGSQPTPTHACFAPRWHGAGLHDVRHDVHMRTMRMCTCCQLALLPPPAVARPDARAVGRHQRLRHEGGLEDRVRPVRALNSRLVVCGAHS